MDIESLLTKLLQKIENDINEPLTIDMLAKYIGYSERQLERIFSFAYNRSLVSYIRSRRLSQSLHDLYEKKYSILDIALNYGFEHEQSYIRSFKREFGMTPGTCRKSRISIPAIPPLQILDTNKINGNLLYGPEVVFVPSITIVGKNNHINAHESWKTAPEAAISFWKNDRLLIKPHPKKPVYYGYTDRNGYLTSVKMEQSSLKSSYPKDFFEKTIKPGYHLRFRYIGAHHYFDISQISASQMYSTMYKFVNPSKITIRDYYYERIDPADYDGTYCQMEWFTPCCSVK
jgi:AraC family transcriptional regulator